MNYPSLGHTIWLQSSNAAFIYLPKAACTSWKIFLGRMLGLKIPKNYLDIHDAKCLPLPYASSFPPEKQQSLVAGINSGNILLIAVLREPKERILSAYLDKIKNHNNPNSYFSKEVIPSIQAHAGIPADQKPSLEDFLTWIASKQSQHTSNDHWLPMSEILGISTISNARQQWHLWSMKKLDTAAHYLSALTGQELPFPSPQELGPRPSTESSKNLAKISDKSSELLESIYRDDLDLYAEIRGMERVDGE